MGNNISPHAWSSFARSLASAISDPSPNNPSILSLYAADHPPFLPASSPNSTGSSPLGRIAVSCADSIHYDSTPTAESMVDETLEILKNVTRRFGASVQLMEQDGGCWLWEATGKAKDVFRVSLRSSLLESRTTLNRLPLVRFQGSFQRDIEHTDAHPQQLS